MARQLGTGIGCQSGIIQNRGCFGVVSRRIEAKPFAYVSAGNKSEGLGPMGSIGSIESIGSIGPIGPIAPIGT
jgi:hypothetical protein